MNSHILILVFMIILTVIINISPLGRKGRNKVEYHHLTGKVKLDDYDEEQKNIDNLSR